MKIRMCLFLLCVLLASPAFAQQNVPELSFDSVPNFFKLPPGMNFGEVPGVAVNSKGTSSCSRGPTAPTVPHTPPRRRNSSNSAPTARSCAKSARVSMPGPKPTACASIRTTTSGPSTKVPTWSSSSTRRAAWSWFSDAAPKGPTRKRNRGDTPILLFPPWMDSSASPPTWRGIPTATSTSPTDTSTRASRNMTRMATG